MSYCKNNKKESIRKANILSYISVGYDRLFTSPYPLFSFDKEDFWNKKFIYEKKNDTVDVVDIKGQQFMLSFVKEFNKYIFTSDSLKIESNYHSMKEYKLVDSNVLTYRGYICIYLNHTMYCDSIYGMSQ